MTIQSRGLCRTCYKHQLYTENPKLAENRRAREREAKRQRRLLDEEWAEKERARDRARTRTPGAPCEICKTGSAIAKGLCKRCYYRTYARTRRAADPEFAKTEKEMIRARVRRTAEVVRNAKDVPCMDCSGKFPVVCMDFDHVRGKKSFNISAAGPRTPESVLREIAKCDVVCSNCHRIRTQARKDAADEAAA